MKEPEIIDVDDLPDDEAIELAGELLGGEDGWHKRAAMLIKAEHGEFDTTPRTKTFSIRGDDKAAALGRAYHHRDSIEDATGCTVECEIGDTAWELEDTMFYEIDFHINGGDE